MITEPVVTALMPVKNFDPGYLGEATASMATQTHPSWRLLIIAEPDAVESLGHRLASWLQDERITVCANEGRKLAGAFNTGMRLATTRFVGILLADDLWSPNAVEVLTRRIDQHPEVDFFHSSRIIVDDEGEPVSSVYLSRTEWRVADFFTTSPVKHLLCWRRSFGLAIGGMDESLNSVGPDDYDFPWSMAERGAVFHAIPECLYRYRDHRRGVRLTTHVPLSTHLIEIRRILKKHGATPLQTFRKLSAARRTYLRQCLYRTSVHKWIHERFGKAPRVVWRDSYRSRGDEARKER